MSQVFMKNQFIQKNNTGHHKSGFALVELIVGSAIMVTSVIAILVAYSALAKISYRNTARVQATMLVGEGLEAVRTIRDRDWSTAIAPLSTGVAYRLYWTGTMWVATTSPAMIDNYFDRTFTLSSVSRDGNFNIVSSGGSVDSGSRKVTVSVSWNDEGATTTKSTDLYLFNTYAN